MEVIRMRITEAGWRAHGFPGALLVKLVRTGLVTAHRDRMLAER